ncbi:hypothetical protein DERP_007402 [Dermatophagoides pteronyssinus]|uniref:Uncharacterized protein n=1 Tax=Dermatophagoides pteronyssinus TaxID=6956 RepID=A0ABQ8J497_DERPT|nr:hypothetical protein DERP_007402 [Dermatophagoides pteronyssinus]
MKQNKKIKAEYGMCSKKGNKQKPKRDFFCCNKNESFRVSQLSLMKFNHEMNQLTYDAQTN